MSLVPFPIENTNNNESISESENLIRVQNNLQGLLTFSTRLHSITANNGMDHSTEQIDEEGKAFLKAVLSDMSVDFVSNLKSLVQTLADAINEPDTNVDKYELILDEVLDEVCCIDRANVFYQIGGLEVITPLLRHENASIRAMAANVIGDCCKNNPYCQQISLKDEVFIPLMELTKATEDAPKLKAISAISAIIQNNPKGIQHFRKNGGFCMLQNALTSQSGKVMMKSLFLINILCGLDNSAKEELIKLGILSSLISVVKSSETSTEDESMIYNDSSAISEYALKNLVYLTEGNNDAINFCKDKVHGLSECLKKLIKEKGPEDAFKELVEEAEVLRKRIETHN